MAGRGEIDRKDFIWRIEAFNCANRAGATCDAGGTHAENVLVGGAD
ncbi:MAG: hypothetical protein OJF62_000581 [Pseudolabrys sp.]|jgi:hypothetical protein|nr:hypothetical protein [Pseudolabrys sp.]